MGIVVEYQYFAPVIFYKCLIFQTHLLLEQYESYQKMSFRNRCVVAGAGGSITLSVPLMKGRNQKSLVKDTRINHQHRWQAQHWATITSCYNRSPWFEYYFDDLRELYKTRFEFLVDWDFACLTWVLKQLDLKLTVKTSDAWRPTYSPEEWMDWRSRLLPNSIVAEFPDAPRYRQVFEERTGFIPHLSILDLLFCEGRNAADILRDIR
jgi:hypothetical protein